MKNSEVVLGATYMVEVSSKLVKVRIINVFDAANDGSNRNRSVVVYSDLDSQLCFSFLESKSHLTMKAPRFIVRRIDNGRILTKPRSALELRLVPT